MMTTQFELALSVRLMILSLGGIDEKTKPWTIRNPRRLAHCILAVTVSLSIGCFAATETATAHLEPATALKMLKEWTSDFTQDELNGTRAYYGMDFGLNLVLGISSVVSLWLTRRVQ